MRKREVYEDFYHRSNAATFGTTEIRRTQNLINENTGLREKGCSGTGISAHLARCIRAFPFVRWRPARETRPGFLSDRRF
ncbi:hypothetical protein SB48_HM08orf02680 [Heyndrickxia coagulans]|uniref:Uncharacterized protein n=1 Tax=Heyndrickxia coagulans TaxID=1398 RepID=A0AAN0WBN5_HEYCO|nr:hypothetical protein SB48_HM08orf02680 [Heyndrickxia coagulans]